MGKRYLSRSRCIELGCVSMKIAIDLDSTIFSLIPEFLNFFNKKHGTSFVFEDITSWNLYEILGVSKSDVYRMFRNFRADRQPIKGALKGCEYLRKKYNAPIVTATQIPFDHLIKKYGIKNKIIVVKSSKEKCDLGFDVYIDDFPYIYKYLKPNQLCIMLERPWNKKVVHPKIIKVKNWDEILLIL